MEIRLTADLEKFVEEKVRAGQFASATEMINNALLLLKDHQVSLPTDPDELAELRRQVAIGIEQADRGQFADFNSEDTKAEGRRRLGAKRDS